MLRRCAVEIRKSANIGGKKFNMLEALRPVYRNEQGNVVWLFRCDCGEEKEIIGIRVASGTTKSCGCLRRETAAKMGTAAKKHGKHSTPEYSAWANLKQRCINESCEAYPDYGGRQIEVCDRWKGPDGFVNFYADMGPRPSPKHSIDRIENDDDYTPENCRWATRSQQKANRRCSVNLTLNGVTQPLVEWAKQLGVSRGTLFWRYQRGLTDEQILSTKRINAPSQK